MHQQRGWGWGWGWVQLLRYAPLPTLPTALPYPTLFFLLCPTYYSLPYLTPPHSLYPTYHSLPALPYPTHLTYPPSQFTTSHPTLPSFPIHYILSHPNPSPLTPPQQAMTMTMTRTTSTHTPPSSLLCPNSHRCYGTSPPPPPPPPVPEQVT